MALCDRTREVFVVPRQLLRSKACNAVALSNTTRRRAGEALTVLPLALAAVWGQDGRRYGKRGRAAGYRRAAVQLRVTSLAPELPLNFCEREQQRGHPQRLVPSVILHASLAARGGHSGSVTLHATSRREEGRGSLPCDKSNHQEEMGPRKPANNGFPGLHQGRALSWALLGVTMCAMTATGSAGSAVPRVHSHCRPELWALLPGGVQSRGRALGSLSWEAASPRQGWDWGL